MGTRVVLYTTQWCPGCRVAKLYLQANAVAFEEIDIERVPGAAEHVIERAGGYRAVPTTIVGDAVVVDWRQREVEAALRSAALL